MDLQLNPNAWSCLPTAFAIALNIPVKKLIETLGHDGSEIIFEDYPEPQGRRGFHTSELIDYCLRHHNLKVSLIPIAVRLWSSDQKFFYDLYTPEQISERLALYLKAPRAVVLEPNHAVAWDGEKVFDPKGSIRSVTSLKIQHIMLF